MALDLTYKGFNYVDFYNGIYDTTNLDTTLPEVAATGADSVALTPDFGVDVAASTIYAGNSTTDTVADLTAAVQEATKEGMTSLVRPLVDILYPQVSPNNGAPNYYVPDDFTSIFDPGGTGTTTIGYNPATNTSYAGDTPAGVTPSSIPKGTSDGDFVNYRGELETTDEAGGDLNAATFFGSATTVGSYDYMIVTEAKAAAAAGATLFSVGTELDALADDPNNTTYWDTLIADVRAAAPSLKLTYSANWSNAGDVTFWNKLDYVGLDGYVPLSNTIPNAQNTNNPSLASLEAGWNTVSNVVIAYSGGQTVSEALDNEGLGDVSAIDAFDTLAQQSIDKQFIFTELGYQNDTGAANDPTGGSATGVPDPSLQAELFSAFFDAWGQAQATAAGDGGKVDGVPYSLVGAYFWDYTPDGENDGWSPELNPAAATVINSNFASPVTAVAETNIAAVGGYEGEPTAARGTAGTSGTGALAGDSDANGAALSITAISGGTVGTYFTTKYGSLQLDANGSYTYFPTNSTPLQDAPTGAPAADVIDFTVTDANGATATSSLTISVYRDPVVVAQSTSTAPGGTASGTAGSAGTGALAGDSDPDGVALSVAAINDLGQPIANPIAGKYGTLTLNANGSYSYVADSFAALQSAFSANSDAALADGFTLFVSGGLGTYSLTTLSVTIDYTPGAEVTALYRQVLGRAPTTTELASGVTAFDNGETVAAFTDMLATSTEAQNDIIGFFQSVLDRTPSPGEVTAWENSLAGGLSLTKVRVDLATSTEAQNDITHFYQTILDRAPSPGEVTDWENSLIGGLSLTKVRVDLATSTEAQNDITHFYQTILNRAPSPGEVTDWENSLIGGLSLTQVRTDLATSTEAQNDIAGLFQSVLGRAATSGEVTAWENSLAGGGLSLTQVRTDLATSTEAGNDITRLIQSILNLTPSPSGITVWENALAGGLSLAQVRVDLATSSEGQNDIIAIFENVEGRTPDKAELAGMENQLAAAGASQSSVKTALVDNGPTGFTVVVPPSGSVNLTALAGPERFNFSGGNFGNDTVVGFNDAQDAIELSHTLAASFSVIEADTHPANGGALITFNGSQSIMLNGINPTGLVAANFHIV